MICDLKKSLRLVAYSFQFGINVIIAVITELVGILVLGMMMYIATGSLAETYSTSPLFFVSGVMILQLAPLMLMQTAISLECSGVILSSPLHKTVAVSLPGFICLADAVQTLLLLVVMAVISKNTAVLGEVIFVSGFVFLLVLVYMTLAFRYFILGVVIYIAGYVGVTILASYVFYNITENVLVNGKTGAALGILAMVVGLVFSSFMRHHLYKKPIAKYSVNKRLRQYL